MNVLQIKVLNPQNGLFYDAKVRGVKPVIRSMKPGDVVMFGYEMRSAVSASCSLLRDQEKKNVISRKVRFDGEDYILVRYDNFNFNEIAAGVTPATVDQAREDAEIKESTGYRLGFEAGLIEGARRAEAEMKIKGQTTKPRSQSKGGPMWRKAKRVLWPDVTGEEYFKFGKDGKLMPYYAYKVEVGEYYITLSDLAKMPKEE